MRLHDESVHFYKVSGAGNHFVLLDVTKGPGKGPFAHARGPLVRALCAQGHSIGADGVLFIEKSRRADFRLVYYNSDGREAPMCGNGTRCAALYAFNQGLAAVSMEIEVGSGKVAAVVKRSGVELAMGEPRDFRSDVSVKTTFGVIRGDFVNTGVPHFVVLPKNWRRLDVNGLGREIRQYRSFGRQGTNVDFARAVSKGTVEIRTYERGVEAETLSCGTGAVAVAVCLAKRGLVRPPVKLMTRGGDTLRVRFDDPSKPLSLTFLHGPAQVVYEGDIGLRVLRTVAAKLARRGRT